MDKLGKYEILEKIGEGGFGAVFRARDPHLKRIVALKTCSHDDPDLQRRFLREGEIVASLQHPNITLIHDLGFEGGTPFLVQEFLSGEDLTGIIERHDELSEDTKFGWLVSVARGLEYAHGKGIVHRDIKPANIRILADGTAKIMDFGIARLAQSETKLTRTGAAMGTIAYMSPEQIDGSEVDHRSDIFAFGVLAYELFAFERPFNGETTSRIVYQILHSEPRNLATLSERFNPGFDLILRGCLAKNPGERFQTFGEVLQAFDRLLAGLSPIDESTVHGWTGAAAAREGAEASEPRPPTRPPTRPGVSSLSASRAGAAATEAPRVSRAPALKVALGGVVAVLAGISIWLLAGGRSESSDAVASARPAENFASAGDVAPARAGVLPAATAPASSESPGAAEPVSVRPAAARQEGLVPPAPTAAGTRQEALVASLVERAERAAQEARGAAERSGARELAAAAFAESEAQLGDGVRALAGGRAEVAYDALTAARTGFEAAARQAASAKLAAAAGVRPAVEVPSPAPSADSPAAVVTQPPAPIPAPAPASGPGAEAEIHRALDSYMAAYERLDAAAVVAVVPSLASRQNELERAFAQYRSLDMQLDHCRIEVAGDRATASCDKRQAFELKVGQGRPVEGKAVFRLSLRAGRWTIDAIEGG